MKKILTTILVFLTLTSFASNYIKVTLILTNNDSKTGLIKYPFDGEHIYFKNAKGSNTEHFESSRVSKIIIPTKNDTTEYQHLKVYLGWKQKRVSGQRWLKVIEKGIATLYVTQTTLTSANPAHQLSEATFHDYYCLRKGEPAAKLIATISTFNNNQVFRAKASLYFQDYPELAAKIKKRKYTWKDLNKVVEEYNNWAQKK
ncbi:hypothetical protein [Prolixibacter denitrificans]|uniref:Uncharacterized protein n=1 Tax=Prolixibacter denitrificans TaxID=1541063 RepID=A0A2P8CCR5_9BACT|nr:hypothetical protein [Prolixibacter denitrificans]PSK82719.1 hypothetical protein CLV93_105111 [Prolixibacter denitrificans]GET21459.1 hypothetical protein JCM18694_17050 [Prolixibacter denitrificans]